jgi:hypothetical protein
MALSEELLPELIEFYREAYLDQKERADALEKRLFKLLRFPEETEETTVKIPATVQPIHKGRRSNWPRQRAVYENLTSVHDAGMEKKEAQNEIDDALKGA